MQFADRYETDIATVREWWREYLWAAYRGGVPAVRMATLHAKFNMWLEVAGRKTTPLTVFRSVWLGT